MTTSDVKTEFTFMRVLYTIMELFFRQPQKNFFSDATLLFSHSLPLTHFNADKRVRELLMERFGMATGFCQTVSKVRITYCTK